MLSSYEAIYDHGRLTWLTDAPGPIRARVIVTLVDERMQSDDMEESSMNVTHDTPLVSASLPRKRIAEDEIERILQKTCGAWGKKTIKETEALIRQQRMEDWGEDEEIL